MNRIMLLLWIFDATSLQYGRIEAHLKVSFRFCAFLYCFEKIVAKIKKLPLMIYKLWIVVFVQIRSISMKPIFLYTCLKIANFSCLCILCLFSRFPFLYISSLLYPFWSMHFVYLFVYSRSFMCLCSSRSVYLFIRSFIGSNVPRRKT